MTNHTKLMTRLVNMKNSKHRSIGSHWFLKKIKLDTYISGKVPVLEGDEAKALHKKNLVKTKKIIVDSIKDHLIPQVSSLKTPKEMFDSLTKLFEGKTINRKKYRNSMILEEIELDQYFSKEVIRARGR